MKKNLVSFVIYGIGGAAQSLAGLFYIPMLTQHLNKTEFGVYSLILVTASIASSFFYFGISSALPRFYFDENNSNIKDEIAVDGLILIIIGAVIQSIFGLFFSKNISLFISGTAEYSSAVTFGFISGAVGFINTYLFTILRIQKRHILAVVTNLMGAGISIFLLMVLSFFIEKITVSLPFITSIVGILVSVIFSGIIFQSFQKKIHFNIKRAKAIILFGLSIAIASLIQLAYDSSDRYLILETIGIDIAGDYSLGLRISSIINVIYITPFFQLWNIFMLEFQGNNNIRYVTEKISIVYLGVGLVLISMMSLGTDLILPLLIKSKITIDIILTYIISLHAILVMGYTNIASAGFFYEKKFISVSIIYIIALFIRIISSLLFLKIFPSEFSVLAVVLALLIGSYFISLSMFFMSKRYFEYDLGFSAIILIIIFIHCIFQVLTKIYNYDSFYINVVNIFSIIIFVFFIYKNGFDIINSLKKSYIPNA